MVKNLKRFKRQFEREQNKVEAAKWDFFPTTFVLPVRAQLECFKIKTSFFKSGLSSKSPSITCLWKNLNGSPELFGS